MNTLNTAVQPSLMAQRRSISSAAIRILGGLSLCLSPLLMSGSSLPSLLERVLDEGVLHMVSLHSPSTFYKDNFGHAGFEFELANAFADELDVKLVIENKENLSDMLSSIATADGHFAAAGLSVMDSRKKIINYSTPYSTVTQQVIYQRGSVKPKTIDDLLGKDIVVISKSSHAANLHRLKKRHPRLQWREVVDAEMLDLLKMVHNGDADIALVDSTAFAVNKSIFPKARLAFDISEVEDIAWVFPKQKDNSLLNAANRFLQQHLKDGKVATLENKYFNQQPFSETNALTFVKRIEKRLPQWIPEFKKAAEVYKLDWLFLAAISYQESLWDKDAKSHTGVRGLMMLTNRTAKDLGIKDRTDPQQSIHGGAKYLTQMLKKIPDDISEPDRTWMALAAYNVGYGHLEDARVLTETRGGDPDKWIDVKKNLPLLAVKKFYHKTKYGYARGWEPVSYVENIRHYHNILTWYSQTKKQRLALDPTKKPLIQRRSANTASLPPL